MLATRLCTGKVQWKERDQSWTEQPGRGQGGHPQIFGFSDLVNERNSRDRQVWKVLWRPA